MSGRLAAYCIAALMTLTMSAATKRYSLGELVSSKSNTGDACIRWAAGDVADTLKAANIPLANAKVAVVVGGTNHSVEAFGLSIANAQVTIESRESVGAMYGLLELAEQILNSGARDDWQGLCRELQPTAQRPFVELRGDNAFLHTAPKDMLFDVPMWKAYIDMLARNRFNLLDLHGLYDVGTTKFPNVFPLLVTIPEYEKAGKKSVQERNLADFKTIVAHAKSRGVHVAFMNYLVAETGVAKTNLADYTAKAVAELIRQVPDLYMLGFRVGETGQPESFFKDAYLRGVSTSPRPTMPLYTRSWLAEQKPLEDIGRKHKGPFDIEIKYNGEQLGLPYHAIQGLRQAPSYSYEGYVKPNAPYRIIWQVRANGTHRYWAWENTAFIRRLVRTLPFGNARGLSLEPHMAYFPINAAPYFRSKEDAAVHRYIWQKHWMWYFAWGRLSYNPDLSEQTFIDSFVGHYGNSGARIYRALQDSSLIVPLAYSYRCQGLDHRNHSPETETGCFGDYVKDSTNDIPRLLQFGRNLPLDARSFIGIDAFVANRINGTADGRIGPVAVADVLAWAAQSTRESVRAIGDIDGLTSNEWRLLRTDFLCAAALADYYAARILGVTHLTYALERESLKDFVKATNFLQQSQTAWKDLADIADAVYAPLQNPLRHQKDFTWASTLPLLKGIDDTAPLLWGKAWSHIPGRFGKPLVFAESDDSHYAGIAVTNLQHEVMDTAVRVVCAVASSNEIAKVLCWHKPLPSTKEWKSTTMVAESNGVFTAIVPLVPQGMLYQVEVRDTAGNAVQHPQPFRETPYRIEAPK